MTLKTPLGSSHTAYEVHGPADAEPIILIHGLGLCRAMWQPFIDALAGPFRVIAHDLFGHGESGPAPEQPSLDLFARQVTGVMDAAGVDCAHIIGFSIGGMINRRLVMDHPHRCLSLVIMNSPHDRGDKGQEMVENRASKVSAEGKMTTLPDALIRWFTPGFRAASPETLDQVRQWREETDDESYAGTAWVLAHGVRELIAPEPPINRPMLVMTGAGDTGSTPGMAAMIAAETGAAEQLIIPEHQHLGVMEQPALYTAPILNFLNRLSGKGS